MTSISSDSRRDRDDTIRKVKEEADNRVAENNKKNKTELRHLAEDYEIALECSETFVKEGKPNFFRQK